MAAPSPAARLADTLDARYAALHTAKEDAFWTARMGLAADAAAAQSTLDRLDIELNSFLQDPARLAEVRAALAHSSEPELRTRLEGWVRTFESHVIDSAQARELAARITQLEGQLEHARGEMELGYRASDGSFVRATSVKLAAMLRSESDERLRRAAWDGLRSIERFVLDHGFLEVLRERNRLGRMLGAEDYYDWKTRRVEGLTKAEVFACLDELEALTRDSARRAVEALAARSGPAAATPWNLNFMVSGDSTREQDPYFPFRGALDRWGRSFASLGIRYRGAQLVLDLVDRKGKYENGFMHGPVVAWRRAGALVPARIHFTANAIPGMVGSGHNAMATLFHEGGHAAHFANIDMPSPCFGQEFAPTSVAFSETQSMLLDSLLDDADWQHRYALDRDGQPMPMEMHERALRASQPFAAWRARAMLAVCYGEKALYEIPDAELSAERVLAQLRAVERRLLFLELGSPRPILAVPHLLAGDSSAYYHGYVLAEMAVHQARAHFLARDGHLVDNPKVGPELARVWWQPGNSVRFDEFVRRLCGSGLSAAPMARELNRDADTAIRDARNAIERVQRVPRGPARVELDARVRVVHGSETVAVLDGDFEAFSAQFERWIDAQVARGGS
ncbi:MAG: peptidase M3 [Planctomycetes bacterium]|nr:peptidase M3 [Planctomycetota bacterium]